MRTISWMRKKHDATPLHKWVFITKKYFDVVIVKKKLNIFYMFNVTEKKQLQNLSAFFGLVTAISRNASGLRSVFLWILFRAGRLMCGPFKNQKDVSAMRMHSYSTLRTALIQTFDHSLPYIILDVEALA